MKKEAKNTPFADKKTFDAYSDSYDRVLGQNLKFFTDDTTKYVSYKVEYLLSARLFPKRILDFGCGNGRASAFLRQAFPEAELCGCDVSEKSVRTAKENYPDVDFFTIAQPDDMAGYNGKFDLIFISCVIHHIPAAERLAWMKSLSEVLTGKGKIAIFEHNPYNPITRHCVATCEFDSDAILLSLRECKCLLVEAGLSPVSSQYTLFFPWRTSFFSNIERMLTWLPLGGQYCVIAGKTEK